MTTPWDVYKVSFNGCDLFNKSLRNFSWPYEHRAQHGVSAEENIADFVEALVLQNTFNAWQSLNKDNGNISYYEFLIILSNEIYNMALAETN